MSNTILIATDGSKIAKKAAEAGLQIARAEDMDVHAIYVVDEAIVLDPYANTTDELGQDTDLSERSDLIERFKLKGEDALGIILGYAQKHGVEADVEVLFGGVPQVIMENIAEAQLITLGRRGNRHLMESDHLGSNFRHIAHHANIPVLAGGDSISEIKRILLVYDENRHSERSLEWASRLHLSMGARVILGAIPESHGDTLSERARKRIASSGLKEYETVILERASKANICETAQSENADLIIIKGYHNPEFIDLLRGRPDDIVLTECSLPVLLT